MEFVFWGSNWCSGSRDSARFGARNANPVVATVLTPRRSAAYPARAARMRFGNPKLVKRLPDSRELKPKSGANSVVKVAS
jgi:hypothetical protein